MPSVAQPMAQEDWSPLDALLAAPIAEGQLSGAVAMAWRGDVPVHVGALGWLDVAAERPMRQDAIFRLYSMTKPVTAAAMMMLWDEGRWQPGDAIADHLPELAGLRLADGTPASPTIEHLLTHSAGFVYGMGDDAADRAAAAAGVPPFPHAIEPADYLARLADVPLAYPPGEAWRYSVAMDVQGLLVERLSGMDFRRFLRERLFEPLGMTDTDFLVPADKVERLARLYAAAGDTIVEVPPGPFAPDPRLAPVMASGGAGLFSTAADYGRFARMLHHGGELSGVRVLSEAAVATMRASHVPGAILAGGFGTAPHWLRPGYEYAYNGIVVTDPAAAGVALGRGTYFWDGAAGSWFWSDPENDVVLVCLTHLLADADLLGLQFRSRDVVAGIIAKEHRS